ncbi:hypothetical protein Pcinc_012437 [Petrolisthes cinctipes]|uniref:Uncharacterized protein n=1 Tax=Petrolisthes cinctipes TaxID=88211 RepID=A0AAE1KRG2_PETCI|nr:hypothetical protein Pcinc_012437 [Petrolisthes cinctipes]
MFKEDLRCSPADLVYGQALCVPGEFQLASSDNSTINRHAFLGILRDTPIINTPILLLPLERQSTYGFDVTAIVCCFSTHIMARTRSSLGLENSTLSSLVTKQTVSP